MRARYADLEGIDTIDSLDSEADLLTGKIATVAEVEYLAPATVADPSPSDETTVATSADTIVDNGALTTELHEVESNVELLGGTIAILDEIAADQPVVATEHPENENLFGTAGNDTIGGGAGDDYLRGDEGDDALMGGDGNDTLIGDAGNDLLVGGAGNDRCFGVFGDDYIDGGAGNDYLGGGDGNDVIFGGVGNDYIEGNSGVDHLYGGDGNDYINGDSFIGGTGIDYLDGGDGDDSLYGGGGDDMLWGGEAIDMLDGGAGFDILFGGAGNDHLYGRDDNDLIYGESGLDWLEGGDGNDHLYGGDGNDYLNGEDGTDVIEGGFGSDYMRGGAGQDVFVFAERPNQSGYYPDRDVISDFDGNFFSGDVIDLRLLFDKYTDFTGTTANQAWTQGYLHLVEEEGPWGGSGTTVYIDPNGNAPDEEITDGRPYDFAVVHLGGVSRSEIGATGESFHGLYNNFLV